MSASVKPGAPEQSTSLSTLVRIGLILTLLVLLVGSVRFARYDWTGLPINRGSPGTERQVGDCLERIGTYRTESGRIVDKIVVDEQQYLALVAYYRGTPLEDLQVACLYDPFTNRSGTSWIAHWLPVEEGLALGLVNTAMTVLGLWFILLALRRQGIGPPAILATGLLVALSWNTFYFGTGLLIDSGVVAAVALCWYLLCANRPWLVWPVLLLGYPLKESLGIVVPVLAVWSWNEWRSGRRSPAAAAAPALAGAVAFVVGVFFWRASLPEPGAAWEVTPDLADVLANAGDVISLMSFAVGVGPLLVPSILVWSQRRRTSGLVGATIDPATIGVLLGIGLCAWSFITVDLTPRIFWIAFPFAASLTAVWFSHGRPAAFLERRALVRTLAGAVAVPEAETRSTE